MITITAKVDRLNPDASVISKAAGIIKSGGLVAFPTETVYGLGADALNPEAVRKIYEAKGRPPEKALILHVDGISQAERYVELNDVALRLMRKFWPGPLTLVLPAKETVPSITRAGLPTTAVRMPDDAIAQAIIASLGTPIAAPSANLSGRPSPVDAEMVFNDMAGRIDMIIDGGSVKLGTPSTIIDATNLTLIRLGTLPFEEIIKACGNI